MDLVYEESNNPFYNTLLCFIKIISKQNGILKELGDIDNRSYPRFLVKTIGLLSDVEHVMVWM